MSRSVRDNIPEARLWPDGQKVAARPCGLCLGLGCRMCHGCGRYEPDEEEVQWPVYDEAKGG